MAKKTQPEASPRDLPPELPGSPGGDDAPPPPFGVEKKADPSGPVPRILDPRERKPASSGLTRYKVRCDNYSPQKTRYILARDEDEARECFVEANGLDKLLARLRSNSRNPAEVADPLLVVTVLPD